MNRRPILCAATAALVLLAASASAAKDEPKLLLLRAQSRIDVDARGNVASVKTTPQLPESIQGVVEANVRKLRFEPPMKDGHAVAGVTYVYQEACAAPVDGQYRLAVKYVGNGPGTDVTAAPMYPRDAEHRGVQSNWHLEFLVDDKGHASVVDMKRTGGDNMMERSFRAELANWIEHRPFEPELLDGKPVPTRMTTDVDFVLGRRSAQASDLASDACKLALEEHDQTRTVAVDSPFKLLAGPN